MSSPTELNLKAIPPLATKSAVLAALTQVKNTKNTLASLALMLIISGPIQQILNSFRHT
jgi:hypothetical protein